MGAEWERKVALGADATSGNRDTVALNGNITGAYMGDAHESRLGIEGNLGESEVDDETETTAQNGKAYINHKHKFINGRYLYTDNSLFHDDLADIEYRLILGVGGGYYVLKTEAAKTGLELGAALIREEATDDTREDNISLRLAVRHDQAFGEHASFWFAAEYLPTTDETDEYLINGETGIEAALNSTLSLRVVVQDRYDNVVSPDKEHNDLSLISSLVYTL